MYCESCKTISLWTWYILSYHWWIFDGFLSTMLPAVYSKWYIKKQNAIFIRYYTLNVDDILLKKCFPNIADVNYLFILVIAINCKYFSVIRCIYLNVYVSILYWKRVICGHLNIHQGEVVSIRTYLKLYFKSINKTSVITVTNHP